MTIMKRNYCIICILSKKITMKRVFVLVSLIFSAFYIVAQDAQQDGPVMTFKETTVDYGKIEQHSDPLREFHFTNTGNEPLIIKNAKGSCGCTVPNYPKEPIMPGESNIIEVRYATNRLGKINKTITLTTNAVQEKIVLRIAGNVSASSKEEAIPAKEDNMLNDPNN